MKTLNNIIDDNMQLLRSLKVTQAESLQRGQMAYHVANARAFFVEKDIRLKRRLHSRLFQTIGCLELEVADQSDCCNVPAGCKVLKSVLPLPDSIHDSYVSIMTIQNKPIQLTDSDRAFFNQYRKYVSNDTSSYIKNRYLYVINEQFLKYVAVRSIFVDPMELASYNTCSGKACFTQDSDYPVPSYMLPLINMFVLKEFGVIYQVKPDTVNDASQEASGAIRVPNIDNPQTQQ